jgi:hypothetical protein
LPGAPTRRGPLQAVRDRPMAHVTSIGAARPRGEGRSVPPPGTEVLCPEADSASRPKVPAVGVEGPVGVVTCGRRPSCGWFVPSVVTGSFDPRTHRGRNHDDHDHRRTHGCRVPDR